MSEFKHIHDTRSTNKFCINAIHAGHIAKIAEHYGPQLICVANDDDLHRYMVRLSITGVGLYDALVSVLGIVEEIKRRAVIEYRQSA